MAAALSSRFLNTVRCNRLVSLMMCLNQFFSFLNFKNGFLLKKDYYFDVLFFVLILNLELLINKISTLMFCSVLILNRVS